ncbi:MAG: glycosyltransferase family 1 protein [Bacteroidales bacterium]|nr:glycosyltransferase family 1 protein [Bacteroidales bacterium]
MNIVVNTQLLLKNRLEGLGWFTFETFKRISRNHPEHQFYFVFDRPFDNEFIFANNVKPIILRPASRHPFLWFLRFEILMPRLLKKLKADVYVGPDGWTTLNTKVPCVQVLHDLNWEYNPQDIPFLIRHYFSFFFPRYARKAKRIATVSEYSKSDIVKIYGINPSLIDVVFNGCNELYESFPENINEQTRLHYAGGHPYFLFVGALLPRKNIERLFKAFDKFKASDKKNTRLLIVGEKKWWTKEINTAYEKMVHRNDVVFLGRLPVEALNKVYAAAFALTFIPYFEGFGIPIIEAFNCGIPIITSNCTSMPEVAGDAAILIDPYDIDDITNAMKRISTDEFLRQQLIAKGHERKKMFSWNKTAAKLWDCIEKAAD